MAKKKKPTEWKMRVSFDLDEVLFVSPDNHKTEPPLKFPLNVRFKERVRLGTPELISGLQQRGYEAWVYTSSFRSERYIRRLFKHYGVKFDGIINGHRHLREVQKDRKETLPQKVPSYYGISLHVDDETVIVNYGKTYGFNVYHLDAQDDDWVEKILERADEIKRKDDLLKKIGVPPYAAMRKDTADAAAK
ncbi:MAG: HAD family hydrolase [Lachnospiraceae bacterium]|nr:HAD family hydrolase [Lachnospiraceae bacterium]